ncbi:MAG TPA: NAD(+) synthase [Anaerolineaceae bacterium]|nr:NAD(+) synthase [Anaerolineaceae bacterium]HQF46455.1 NAD(+) synthase [Anaerolineaceae bacterium]HQH36398.1 NAD(+) synthase [Anaerolineaceae bacterium]HQJ04279.1 NAD(+) synthase [Anaerolineaceae bacterium]
MNNLTPFDGHILDLNVEQEVNRITDFLRESILQTLHRRGAIVGISGGIDSSVVLALCVRALGPQRVVGILMPERESSPDSAILAQKLADQFGIATVLEDITGALDGSGCYQRRDEAVRRIFPAYGPEWKLKITLPGSLLDQETLNVFRLTVVTPDGEEMTQRLPVQEFLQIVAASNFKQRTRMAMLYYHAELHSFAVVGTPNKNEHDLGFFVKYGDGGLDVSPIVHLFKSQVYQLAKYLDIPEEIQERVPTSDTYSAGSTQEEFFFRLPFRILDTIWRGMELGYSPDEIASALNLTPEQVNRVMDDIQRKQRTTEYLRKAVLDLPYPPQD